jgi:hypothetical protein
MTPPRGTITLQEAGKALFSKGYATGPERIFEQLRNAGLLIQGNMPRQCHLERGLFRVESGVWEHPKTGRLMPYTRVFITAKGLEAVERLMPRPTIKKSLIVRPAARPEPRAEVKQQWQPQVELNWPVCVLGM